MQLKPSEIRFSQDSINNRFDQRSNHSYTHVGETLDDLCEGRCSINDIPTITVVNEDGQWITADNRRLWVFRELERLGKCTTIPVKRGHYIPESKRTSYNSGKSIDVRRNPGGSWHRKPSVRTPKPSANIDYIFGEPLQSKRFSPSIANYESNRIQPFEPTMESYFNLRNKKDTVLPFQTNEAAIHASLPTDRFTSTPFRDASIEANKKPSTMIYWQHRTDDCRSISSDNVTARSPVSKWSSDDITMFPVTSTGTKMEGVTAYEYYPRHDGYKEGVFRSAVTTNDTRAVPLDNIRSISSQPNDSNMENVIPDIQGEGRQSRDAKIANTLYLDEQQRKPGCCTIL